MPGWHFMHTNLKAYSLQFNLQENSWKAKETRWPSEIETDFTVTSFNEELYVIGGCDDSYQAVVLYEPFKNTVQSVINGAVRKLVELIIVLLF